MLIRTAKCWTRNGPKAQTRPTYSKSHSASFEIFPRGHTAKAGEIGQETTAAYRILRKLAAVVELTTTNAGCRVPRDSETQRAKSARDRNKTRICALVCAAAPSQDRDSRGMR